ncbi:MAG: hypothetical protein QOI47_1903, partial [Actinomycetota bacterium]|nr:hypothetical protein [Actinomycetota bacterium]
QVDDYDSLATDLLRWRDRGTLIAIDDTGSGYASLRHVLRLAPDYIKLDRSLIEGIEHDRSQRALVGAFVAFARETGAMVLAEGVETRAQLMALRDAGVPLAQGYLLGRPAPAWRGDTDYHRLRVDHCATVDELGESVCEHLATFDVMPSFYLERDGVLRCVAQRGLWQVLDGLAPGAGITGEAFQSDTLVVVDDVASDPHYLEAVPGVVAEACIPIRSGGVAVGALNIDSLRPLTGRDIAELRRCAALVNERMDSLGPSSAPGPLALLLDATDRLQRATTDASINSTLLDAARAITGMPTAVLVRSGGAPEDGSIAVSGSLRERILDIGASQLASLVSLVGPSRSCYSADQDDAVCVPGTDVLRDAGVRTLALVPIRPTGGAPGVLAVASEQRRHLHTDTIELLELLAAQAANRLETIAHLSALRRLAHEDSLTGLGNRLAFGEAIARIVDERLGGAVAVLDVDGFKRVNDTFGHLEGDGVLQRLASAFRDAVRPSDAVFRLGGDEFAVLLPHTSAEQAAIIGQRIELSASAVLADRADGVSIGVAMIGPSAEDAVRDADQLLYGVKRARLLLR